MKIRGISRMRAEIDIRMWFSYQYFKCTQVHGKKHNYITDLLI